MSEFIVKLVNLQNQGQINRLLRKYGNKEQVVVEFWPCGKEKKLLSPGVHLY